MAPRELLLFKQYDSDTSKLRFTPHTAFDDPTTLPNAPVRESCELRAICFFDTPTGTFENAIQALHRTGQGVAAPDIVARSISHKL